MISNLEEEIYFLICYKDEIRWGEKKNIYIYISLEGRKYKIKENKRTGGRRYININKV